VRVVAGVLRPAKAGSHTIDEAGSATADTDPWSTLQNVRI
jgi:hypothetical protein